MSAFHPAVYGALYVALREHQEAKASAEAVSDMYDTSAQIAYHDAVIASLDELLGVLHIGEADAAEQDRQIAEQVEDGIDATTTKAAITPTRDLSEVEYYDAEEAAAIREIEREMAIEAGDDSELDAQIAADDARAERHAAEGGAL